VLTAGLAASLTVTASDLHADVDTIGHRAASQASTTADLYFEVSEMDADVANALLVGQASDLGTTTVQAAADYEKHRVGVDSDLQTTVEVASRDASVQHALRTVIDGLGRYEALTADTLQLDTAGLGPAGAGTPARPPAASLALPAGHRSDAQPDPAFLAKSQRLAELPGTTIATYDADLAKAIATGDMGGYFGTEIHNITFAGEYDTAMSTLSAYQTYEKDDRALRSPPGSTTCRGGP
jgi:hypothetical protein